MTALAEFPPLPQFKGTPGWEFTDLSGLDLDDYGPAAGGDETAVERVTELFGDVEAGARPTQGDGGGPRTGPPPPPPGGIVEPPQGAAPQHPGPVQPHPRPGGTPGG